MPSTPCNSRPRRATAFIGALTLASLLLGGIGGRPVRADVGALQSAGTYVDAGGEKHDWRISASHLLYWNNQPFVPVGGLFQARSWSANATDADWQSDQEAITRLKQHNVTDVYVQAAQGGLTDVPPAAIQRLLDALDAAGFTYGISIDDGPREDLTGYVVRPGAFFQALPEEGGSVRIPTEGATSFFSFIVSSAWSDIIRSNAGAPSGDMAQVDGHDLPGTYFAFIVPKMHFTVKSGIIGYPDVWDGFDNYRDALLTLFHGVKLGKGFRFFVDPLRPDLSLGGSESEKVVPTGAAFCTEWSAYLTWRYKSLDKVEEAWGVMDNDARDIDEVAHFIPLWGGGKGVEDFYDLLTNKTIRVDSERSAFWRDLSAFKTESLRRYMNDLSTVLKTAVADVPVVYRTAGHSELFSALPVDQGFDGIGIDAYGRGMDLVRNSAGYAFAQASDAPRTIWLPVMATADSAPSAKGAPGYSTRLSMDSDFDYLREIGARGFYVDAVHVADPARRNFDLSEVPDQLGWLADYARLLVATGVRPAETIPTAYYYPRGLLALSPRMIPHVGWWLPTDRPAVVYNFGSVVHAYALNENGNAVYYLFSTNGTRRIHIKIPKASRIANAPQLTWSPAGAGEMHKDELELTVGPDPVRLLNMAATPVPEEAFPSVAEEADKLLRLVKQRFPLDAGRFQEEVSMIEVRWKGNKEPPYNAVQELQKECDDMRAYARPYAWLEAESAGGQSFDEVSDRAGASGGRVLLVDPRPAGAPTAIATYTLNFRDNERYDVWVAASPKADLTFRLDGGPMMDHPTMAKQVGDPYADGTLVWMLYGTATITPGQHTLELRADGPAAVDVILLMHAGEFVPDGINPPPIGDEREPRGK